MESKFYTHKITTAVIVPLLFPGYTIEQILNLNNQHKSNYSARKKKLELESTKWNEWNVNGSFCEWKMRSLEAEKGWKISPKLRVARNQQIPHEGSNRWKEAEMIWRSEMGCHRQVEFVAILYIKHPFLIIRKQHTLKEELTLISRHFRIVFPTSKLTFLFIFFNLLKIVVLP